MIGGSDQVPWDRLNDYILSLSNIPTFPQFVADTLSGLKKFLYYDRALAYFFDGNGKIRNQYLVDYDERWSTAYLEYYSKLTDIGQLSIISNVFSGLGKEEVYNRANFSVTDWTRECSHEFMTDYIRVSGLKHSLNFELFNTRDVPSVMFALDRLSDRPFTKNEMEIARFLIPHLNSLNKKYFFQSSAPDNLSGRKHVLMELAGLTKREKEVALALCSGVSPANISKRLHITHATTHKHIAHIYEKLHVSNLQEMLVYLLNPQMSYDGTQ